MSYQLYEFSANHESRGTNHVGNGELGNWGIGESTPNDSVTIYRTDINWIGTNKDFTVEKGKATSSYTNYYLTVCPNGITGVKSYEEVVYRNIYQGIDLRWYEKNGQLEYDFILKPGAEYAQIQWEVEGAGQIEINRDGQLIIQTPLGEIRENPPVAFQANKEIKAKWKVSGNKVSFELGRYNKNKSLVIDPIVQQWGTYYGAFQKDEGVDLKMDASKNIFIAGYTESYSNVATTGSHQTTFGGGNRDAMLLKFNKSGELLWSTYYGGSGFDIAYTCAFDGSSIYISGRTNSTNAISTSNVHQDTLGGQTDAFLAKFDGNGSRIWATYYGGNALDEVWSVTASASSGVIIAGKTLSSSAIATSSSHQNTIGGSEDAFMAKFSVNGVRQWATYYGGSGNDFARECEIDGNGNIYVAGEDI